MYQSVGGVYMHSVVSNRCHHVRNIVLAVVSFLDVIARSSHMCWSATHSPVGEAPSRPSRQNQVYVTASFSGMTCRWRFYVVGPCRRSNEVLHRFQSVLTGLGSFLPVTLSIYHRVRSPKLPSRPSLHACGRAKLV